MTEHRRGTFEALVSRTDTHVVLDLDSDGTSLLVLFGGIAGGVSMPVFEFFRLTSAMPGKKAFLRDPLRGWYQRGIPGIGDAASDVRQFLEGIIGRAGVDRVVMVGASAGGFAALLFGAWCDVDEVIAFSPQSFLDDRNRRLFGDARWPEQIDALHGSTLDPSATLDVVPVLASAATKTRYQVHVSADDSLDLIHAQRLAHIAGLKIIEHANGGHRLVKTLRDRGLLQPILMAALAGNHP